MHIFKRFAKTNEINNLKEMFKLKILNIISLLLVVIGAINWGLIGFFKFDLVSMLFGNMSVLTRIIFALVGIAGLYSIAFFNRVGEIGES